MARKDYIVWKDRANIVWLDRDYIVWYPSIVPSLAAIFMYMLASVKTAYMMAVPEQAYIVADMDKAHIRTKSTEQAYSISSDDVGWIRASH